MNSPSDLQEKLDHLQSRLEEAEATLKAINQGEVDAIVVQDGGSERVFTLVGADQPYRLVVEAMRLGAATLANDGTILYCNTSFATLLRLPQEELIGRSVGPMFMPGNIIARIRRFADVSSPGSEMELAIPHADGSRTFVAMSVGELRLQGDLAYFLIVRDLSEQKKLEAMAETDRRKDEFLAMLAHELRNPLAPIANALAMLGMAQRNGNSQQVIPVVSEIMDRQLNQLTRIVDDLLDVSRITRGIITLQRQPLDVSRMVADAVETIRPLIASKGHRLHASFPSETLQVNGDYARLSQVLANVLNNAAKYTENGGDIRVVVESAHDEVLISISDTGIGVSPELLPHVFEMFTQAERSLDRSQGGLGIGLTVVKKIVQLHDGRIDAHSDGLGAGSEFVIRLPRLRQATDLAAPLASRELPQMPGLRILVVDDNRDAADTMAMLLQCAGQKTLVAYDGHSALATIDDFRPHLVLLDLGLPGMDGYAVARSLRDRADGRRILLAAVTGYGDVDDRERTRAAGFDYHYVKPLNFSALNEVLQEIIVDD